MDIPVPFKKYLVGTSSVLVDEQRYSYAIIDQELEPRIPGFVGFPGGKFLFISNKVPIRYYKHFLAHEVREFVQMKGAPGSCLACLMRELQEVAEDIREAYIQYRYELFTALLLYYQSAPASDELRENLQQSYEYLRKKVIG